MRTIVTPGFVWECDLCGAVNGVGALCVRAVLGFLGVDSIRSFPGRTSRRFRISFKYSARKSLSRGLISNGSISFLIYGSLSGPPSRFRSTWSRRPSWSSSYAITNNSNSTGERNPAWNRPNETFTDIYTLTGGNGFRKCDNDMHAKICAVYLIMI